MRTGAAELALSGRRVLITGATGGIGRVTADRLARSGALLVLVARRGELLRDLAAELPGGPHESIAMDVRDERGWSEAARRIAPNGSLHGVVTAAAALTPIGPIGTWDPGEFRSTLDLNVTGTLLAVLGCLDALKATRGSIVTFSGGGATAPLVRFDAYASSKAAVVRLTENLARELESEGVRANSVAPGFVVSPMHDETIAAGSDAAGHEYFERTARSIAEGGDPPSLAAELVEFLLSDGADGITGKLLSAKWDPWRDPSFQRRLVNEPDFATLRRIDDQFFSASHPVQDA